MTQHGGTRLVLQLELGRNHTLEGLLKNEEEVYLPGSLMSLFFTGQISPFRSLTLALGLFLLSLRLFRMLDPILGGLVFHPKPKVIKQVKIHNDITKELIKKKLEVFSTPNNY